VNAGNAEPAELADVGCLLCRHVPACGFGVVPEGRLCFTNDCRCFEDWVVGRRRDFRPALRRNSRGPDVITLQGALATIGMGVLVTGNFEETTENAVKAFQRRAGLEPDGIVGRATWHAFTRETRS
jgi:hypothetical protein